MELKTTTANTKTKPMSLQQGALGESNSVFFVFLLFCPVLFCCCFIYLLKGVLTWLSLPRLGVIGIVTVRAHDRIHCLFTIDFNDVVNLVICHMAHRDYV